MSLAIFILPMKLMAAMIPSEWSLALSTAIQIINRFSSAPSIGIRLNEVFSYEIIQAGARIDVLVRKGG